MGFVHLGNLAVILFAPLGMSLPHSLDSRVHAQGDDVVIDPCVFKKRFVVVELYE